MRIAHRIVVLLLLFLLGLALTVVPATAIPPTTLTTPIAPAQLFEQGAALYQSGQFAGAAQAFQQAAQAFQTQGDRLKQAAALSNLAFSYQRLGQWQIAQETITTSLKLLNHHQPSSNQHLQLLAQTLDIQAGLQLAIGKSDDALSTWQQVTVHYTQLNDKTGIFRSRINQAKALQINGFYGRALKILEELSQSLENQPDSITKVIALRSLGDSLQLIGDLARSRQVLQQSLDIAKHLQATEEISAIYLSLGNMARTQQSDEESAQQNFQEALNFYQQAIQTTSNPLVKVQAQANQLSVLVNSNQLPDAIKLAQQIYPHLNDLPQGRDSAYTQINFAQTTIDLNQRLSTQNPNRFLDAEPIHSIPNLLAQTIQQAKLLNDVPTQAYAKGVLGYYFEQREQWSEAQRWTEQALQLIQNIDAPEIAYRYLWQSGRLFSAQGDLQRAKVAYEGAILKLQSLRNDLASINRDAQFNFRDSVEPIYRQGVALLLRIEKNSPSPKNLNQAREWIEALQLAELDDYFRSACINTQSVVIDQIVDKDNQNAAIIYPIILEQELQVIVKIPKQSLESYSISQPKLEVEKTLQQLRIQLVGPRGKYKEPAQTIYNWLIQPIEADLQKSGVNTLVFVLDGEFRNVPMAALYDGSQYLVEKYAVALSLGLQLISPKAIAQESHLKAIAAGLVDPPPKFQEYDPLPAVKDELDKLKQAGIEMKILLNQDFTSSTLERSVRSLPFNVVHLATHGQFSSKAKETYILASDGPIGVEKFDTVLRNRSQTRLEPIELLVLSACQTASGDNRATLGLAGVAIRAGARSTLASLWQINDRSTALLIGEFYRELVESKVTKAEALRRAQLFLIKKSLENLEYSHPQYWAPFVLVGNWL